MLRRHLLRNTALAAVAIGLPACTPTQVQNALALAENDLGLIASGLAKVAGLTGTIPGIAQSTVANIGSWISQLQGVVAAGANTLTTTGEDTLTKFETILNNVIGALSSVVALPGPISAVLLAISVVLPEAEALINSFFGKAAPATPVSPTAALVSLTPDKARAILTNPFAAAL